MYVIFEAVIRPVLFAYLPSWFPYRWNREGKLPACLKGWLTVTLLGLVGVGTHLLWDQFTHKGAWIVNQIPFLTQLIHIGSLQIPVYKLYQHGSSLFGLILILCWIHRHLYVASTQREHSYPVLPFWYVFVVIYILVMLMTVMKVVDGEGISFVLQLVVPAISSFMLAIFATCLVFWRAARGK
ncbi:DUF4184 family protein [Paenibacillus lautus]|uniref:DUF4184 family protein n=1 Tax=Paenibacillus lautus TaxID=1401 RepID=UPI003D2868A6